MRTETSYLVQRLEMPFVGEPKNLLETISACGLQANGFTQEARDCLRQFCRFDYMGSAEFEFGAIPASFKRIFAEKDKYVATGITLPFYYKSWKDKEPKEGTRMVYIICKADDLDEVIKRISHFAVGDPAFRTKERVKLAESLAESKFGKDITGWMEIENDFMFFKNMHMFLNFKALFGIKVQKGGRV